MCDCMNAEPISGDPRNNPLCCLVAMVCPMPTSMYLRYKALNEEMSHYSCCQGYYDCMCWQAGTLGEKSCPWPCLFLEAFVCPSCAISATRALMMDTRNIQPDPCDARLIRINNALQVTV
ncbi:hypothetical protein T484DRAFT_1780286 [Baffinella frigidus]|nr:hypothetical protein T484DRAFT_1780286 [Cryptophyta sp. CCMP2293]